MKKKILYVDMDGVIADFDKKVLEINPKIITLSSHAPNYEARSLMVEKVMRDNPRLFRDLPPIENSIETVKRLWLHFDVLFLSTPCPFVVESFSDKMTWLYNHFGDVAANRLILSQRKELSIGDYLVDDRIANGAGEFTGKHILFGKGEFEKWSDVETYLMDELKPKPKKKSNCKHKEFEVSEYHQNGQPDRYRCANCGKDQGSCY